MARIALAAVSVTFVMCAALLLFHLFRSPKRASVKPEPALAAVPTREEATPVASPASVDHPSIEPAF